MGKGIRDKLIETALEIMEAGINDPEMFELVGLLEEGVGSDRISDMTAGIIINDLKAYTSRIFTDLELIDPNDEPPKNPYSGKDIILVPREILRALPVANDPGDIDRVVAHNATLRTEVNRIIGSGWTDLAKLSKRALREILLGSPSVLRAVLDNYKTRKAEPYDFRKDPADEVNWKQYGEEWADKYPAKFTLPANPTIDQLQDFVRGLCEQFQQYIENNGLNAHLYRVDGKPRREKFAQLLFFVVADAHCSANGIDINPEVDAGRGPVDFKFSKGYELRVLVEVKKSTNQNLIKGYTKQLPQYGKSEKTKRLIYLVLDVGAPKRVQSLLNEASKAKSPKPEIFNIDATLQPSASKL